MSKKKNIPETIVVDQVPSPAGARVPMWVVGVAAVALVLIGFATVVAVRQQKSSEPLRLPPDEIKPAAAAKPTPAPWTYDSVTNQHWNPEHGHWDKGPPPNQSQAGASVPKPAKPAPNIPNPTAWQYDAASDQHFNPDHNHWHGGQPPADKAATASAPVSVSEAPAPPVANEVAPAAPSEPVAVEEAVEAPAEPTPAPEPAPAP